MYWADSFEFCETRMYDSEYVKMFFRTRLTASDMPMLWMRALNDSNEHAHRLKCPKLSPLYIYYTGCDYDVAVMIILQLTSALSLLTR